MDVIGYLKGNSLTKWDGRTMLVGRRKDVRSYRDHNCDTTLAVVFRLQKGHWITGYALHDGGGLFRGESFRGGEDDARAYARSLAEYWMQIDADHDALMTDDTAEDYAGVSDFAGVGDGDDDLTDYLYGL